MRDELALALEAGAVLAVSEAERAAFENVCPGRVHLVGHAVPATPTPSPAENRREILFVGAFHELSPNEDAACWFLTAVLPIVRARLGDTVKVSIVGPDPPEAVARFAGPGIDVPGPVPDLRPAYDRARIFIAPTRFAAGIPLKVVDAAAHGVPAVVTPLLASQLAWTPGEELLVGDSPQAFAESCIRLFEDAALWARIRRAALARIERDYAPAGVHRAARRGARPRDGPGRGEPAVTVPAGPATAPRVSVLVPCYNLGAYLDEAVDSVLAQSCQDFEILIVDDGSTDAATVQLLDRYERPRTTVYRTANQGLAAARNFLVARARGEYLCALDADDKLHPQYLERTMAALDRDPSLGFASTKMQMFGGETSVWPDDTRCDLVTLLCHDPVHCAALVRRSAVLAVGGYDQGMRHQGNEDWDLWIGLTEAGYGGVILDEVLFYYRRRPGSMSYGCARGDAHLDSVAFLMRKHAASYEAHATAVAQWKADAASGLERRNAVLEASVAAASDTVARRRRELEVLRQRLQEADGLAPAAAGDDRAARLEAELRERSARLADAEDARRAAAADAEAMRASDELAGHRPVARDLRPLARGGREPQSMSGRRDHDLAPRLLEAERRIVAAQERYDELGTRKASLDVELQALHAELDDVVRRLESLGHGRVELGDLRRTTPLSPVWGLDRGVPLDRYYIHRSWIVIATTSRAGRSRSRIRATPACSETRASRQSTCSTSTPTTPRPRSSPICRGPMRSPPTPTTASS